MAQPVSAGHKCSSKAVSTMRVFLCARHHCHHHILAECVRRECLHLPPFFTLPFALFPPCFVVCVQVSGGVFVLGPRKVSQVTAHSRVVNKICAQTCAPMIVASSMRCCNRTRSRRQWHRGVSALRSWGRAAKLCEMDPWPPSREVLDANAFFFEHGPSLSRYQSHIRSALRLIKAPVNVLAKTAGMIRGAMKLSAGGVHFKPRADAEQTRALVNGAKKDFGCSDIANNWIVARHFCLRYGAEVVPMQTVENHSAVHVAEKKNALPVVTLTLFRRKYNSPVTVVRRCICKLQGTNIVRRLRSQNSSGKHSLVFLMCWYTESLAYLEAAVMHL